MSGQVYSTGNNGSGQLGNGTTTAVSSPVSVLGLSNAVSVNCTNHSLAIDSSGMVWAWGANSWGQLGDNTTSDQSSPVSICRSGSYTAIKAGNEHALAIDGSTGMVWAWGANWSGQLGNDTMTRESSPVSIIRSASYVAISAGYNYSLVINSDGMIYGFGSNGNGQLGDNTTTDQSSPVSIIRSASYVAISAGSYHSLAIDSVGGVWAWGNNYCGRLGTGDTTDQSSPVAIARSGSYVAISAGNYHSLAIDSSGMVLAWGYNYYGQLGTGDTTDQSSPVSICRSGSYVAVSAGSYHSLALDSTGVVWAWGQNYDVYSTVPGGRLGDNTETDRSSPVSIARAGVYAGIAAGYEQSLFREDVPSIVADFSADVTSGYAPLTVNFTDLSSGGTPTGWDWDYGDGSTHGTTQNPTHVYSTDGTYSVTLQVTDGVGSDTLIKTDYITVSEPIAEFSGTPTTGAADLTVVFTDASVGAVSWAWVFGDGGSSTLQNPAHIYTVVGTYTVALTVNGLVTETKTDYVTVTVASSFTMSVSSGDADLEVQFTDTTLGGVNTWYSSKSHSYIYNGRH
jgi:PKD repeat protein